MAATSGNAASGENGVSGYNKRLENETFPPMSTLGENEDYVKETLSDDYQLMPGIQLDSVRSFGCQPEGDIHVTPIIVDFRSLLLSKTEVEIVKGVS